MVTTNTCICLTWQIDGHCAVAPWSQQPKGVDLLPMVGGEGLTMQQEDCEGSWSFGDCLFAVDGQGLKQWILHLSHTPVGERDDEVHEDDTVRGLWGQLVLWGLSVCCGWSGSETSFWAVVREMIRSMKMIQSEDCEGSWSFGDCLFGLDGQDLKQSNI